MRKKYKEQIVQEDVKLTKHLMNQGLTDDEVRDRMNQGLVNESVKNQSKSVGQIIAGNVFTYFNFIFAIFSVLLIFVRSYINMTFLPIIFWNTLIGIVQEIRSKRVLDKLSLLDVPQVEVLRNGKIEKVSAEQLVHADVCYFAAGSQIPADARIIDGMVRVNESMITGEADEIAKTSGAKLYSGSFIVSGNCRAVLERVGLQSYAAKLALEAKASRKKQQTEMMRSLDRLVKLIGIAIVPIGCIMIVQSYFFLDESIKDSVVGMVAALVGMIPEGLYLLASVALVVSVIRLAKKKILVHEMACVETLARVDVLCVDKTGTITENKMAVKSVIPLQENDAVYERPLHQMIGDVVQNQSADNITMSTLRDYFQVDAYETAYEIIPFSSETKFSGAVFKENTYLIGAPEKLLLEQYEAYQEEIMQFTAHGERVLVFGSYDLPITDALLQHAVYPLALIVLDNPIRKDAKETFHYFAQQGVNIKVISGDHPATVSYVAKEAGIHNADEFIDASTLDNEEKIREAVEKYTVFGRVQPEQKRQFVQALKQQGHIVAMTGDGVNDVLALKSADCSIAMASGSEAASNASQLVLLDSDFASMPSVVLEGRRVVNNIQRAASLFLVKNIFSILLSLFTIVTLSKYPLYPTQLSLLGTFTIGTPAFFLALQPNKSRIQGSFVENVLIKALPAGLTDFFVVSIVSMYGQWLNIPHEQLSTMATLVLLTVGIIALIRICRPFDWIRLGVCIIMAGGAAFSVAFLKFLFAIVPLSVHLWMITVLVMGLSVIVFWLNCKLVWHLLEKKRVCHHKVNL